MNIGETKIKVRYQETDQMGIVHHSNYLIWFEVGRTEFLHDAGFNYGRMEERGVMLPLTEARCTYLHGAKYEDNLIIRTWIEKFAGVRLTMAYEAIREEDGLLLAKGSTVHAFTDKSLKPINVRRKHPEIYQLFMRLMG
ncbi:MAG: acyl-CoA thioesterase [Caldicoprobacterales bacterium]|jgi:acyl-CoA thioester hydrolase|nr:acyl-CoA thioesterase [Clostridiales bacterium]